MGGGLSKRKSHKDKTVEKETWTTEAKEEVREEGEGKPEATVKLADKANQCVLQWIQHITSDGERTNLDEGQPKRPHSEICMRRFYQSQEPLVGKVDLSCCDWLHKIGLPHSDQSQPPPPPLPPASSHLDQSDEAKSIDSVGSIPDVSSLSNEKEEIENDAIEAVSLESFPETGPAPERIKKLADEDADEAITENTMDTLKAQPPDILSVVGDGNENRKMIHQASSIARLKATIAEQSAKLRPKNR